MALSEPLTGMATAVDIAEEKNMHPRDEQDVAHRLSLVAAQGVYRETPAYSGPTYQSEQTEGSAIRIRFANVGSGLLVRDKHGYVCGFEIAGEDGQFVWAQARRDGNEVVVSAHGVSSPRAVRYDCMIGRIRRTVACITLRGYRLSLSEATYQNPDTLADERSAQAVPASHSRRGLEQGLRKGGCRLDPTSALGRPL